MKKMFLVLMMIFVTFSANLSFASTSNDTVSKKITYNEYIQMIMKEKNISRAEAIKQDNINTRLYTKDSKLDGIVINAIDDSVYYASRETNYTVNSSFRAKIGATFKVYKNVNNKEILNITNMYTGPSSGSGNYTWNQLGSVWNDVSSYPTYSALIGGSGYFQVITSVSGGGSIDLGGFQLSGSIGSQDIYTSPTVNMTLNVSANQL